MIYKVFNFKSLKIALAKTANGFVGYSVDTKYPEYCRPLIRGSAKEVVEVCIYLYQARLLTAYNCEGYEVPSCTAFDINSDTDVRDWVEYIINRYLLATFDICYEHRYKEVTTPYIDEDGVPCSLIIDHIYEGIAIKYWDDDEESW